MDGKLYMLCVSSCIASSISTNTVHNFSVLLLHPWRTGGSLVEMVIVPCLWMVTPSSAGLKTVMYPSSDILFTLRRDFFSPGSTSSSCAASNSLSKESFVLFDVCSCLLSGRNTVLKDAHSMGKFKSLLMK